MKITVLNGSPKGDLSVTVQYVRFIEKKFRDHEFSYINVSAGIKKIETDASDFDEIIKKVQDSDLIIWAVPLYVMLVPSQYKRFIELISERGAEGSFRGKYTSVITTSIHFYDNTAHNYMRGICDDLGMVFTESFSPDMYDLMKDEEQRRLLLFASSVFSAVQGKLVRPAVFPLLNYDMPEYIPSPVRVSHDLKGKRMLILSDREYGDSNTGRMIKKLSECFRGMVTVKNLDDVEIKGGCLGCCECGFDYRCIYTGKDGFIDFYNSEIKTSDIIVFAGEIKDRFLSWKFKQMFDRAFFNTHTPTLKGKQLGFFISGPFSCIPNLRQILQAYVEWQGANMVDIISDEQGSPETDMLIDSFACRAAGYAESGYVQPVTFLGVGGMKIFRDDVWGRLRFVFQADHRYYEENGIYDFPQNDQKTIDINEKMMDLTSKEGLRENIRKMIKTEMVKPVRLIVETR